jgi:DNA modification methylase
MIFHADDQITLHHGDALDVARTLPNGAADCIVTSPPYYNMRSYNVDGQYGLEATPAEHVEHLRALFAELRRVLADDGTLWLVIGDSYSAGGHGGNRQAMRHHRTPGAVRVQGFAPKNLLLIPARVAIALQDDGWIVRNDNIWHKLNALPESATDRLSRRHEYVYMFAKKPSYWFDLDPIREPHTESSIARRNASRRHPSSVGKGGTAVVPGSSAQAGLAAGKRELNERGANPGTVWSIPTEPSARHIETDYRIDRDHAASNVTGRNPGTVWSLPTEPFPGAHFAVMPLHLALRCIQAGCPPRRCQECGHTPKPIIEKGDLVTTWPNQHNLRHQVDAAENGGTGDPYTSLDFRGGKGGHAFPRRERTATGYTDCGHNAYRAGIVLDPFSGSGTTGLAAQRTGRHYIGVDLNADYLDMSLNTRLRQLSFDSEVAPGDEGNIEIAEDGGDWELWK